MKWRLGALTALILLADLGIVGVILFLLQAQRQQSTLEAIRLAMEASLYALGEEKTSDRRLDHPPYPAQVLLLDRSGRVLYQDPSLYPEVIDLSFLPDVRRALAEGFGWIEGELLWTSLRHVLGGNIFILRWGFDARRPQPSFLELSDALLAILPALLLQLVLVYWFARGFQRGLRSLLEFTEKATIDSWALPTDLPPYPEFRSLAVNIGSLLNQGKEKNDALVRRNQELESLLSGMSEGVIVCDERLSVRRINPAARELFDCSSQEPAGLNILEITHSSAVLNLIEKILWDGGAQESEIITPQGKRLQVRGNLVLDEHNKRLVILVFNDITNLQKLEEVRRDFVANVSHELKTPITAIKGYVETLLESKIKRETRTQFLQIIRSHADRMNNIIEDLLTLSRLERPDSLSAPARFCLREAINEAVELNRVQAEKKKMALELIQETDQSEIEGHQRLVVQAISNLIDNAIKYSDNDSTVKIILSQEANFYTIAVIDRGIGIPPKDQERIFERFYRVDKGRSRARGGTGLGLSIVKHVMLLHGGRVEVLSTLGSGSTFTLYFPKKA